MTIDFQHAMRGLGVVLVAVLVGPHSARSSPETAVLPAHLGEAAWRVELPGHEIAGRALWLRSANDSWRCEIALAPASRHDLRQRRGEGWTVTVPAPGVILHQAWSGPWRETGAADCAALATVLSCWTGDRPLLEETATRGRRWRLESRPHPISVVLSHAGLLEGAGRPGRLSRVPKPWLRRALTRRGRGRGGEDLRLRLRPGSNGDWRVDTPRWPATLYLDPPSRLWRETVPAEVFLPVWNLLELDVAEQP